MGSLNEPTYFERDFYDLPLSLIRVNPNSKNENTLIQHEQSNFASEQQHLIAPVLAKVLTPLGVRFEFSIKHHPQSPAFTPNSEQTLLQSADVAAQALEYRLWVRCHSSKSLDCQILAEPLAKALRSIDLQDFQDAIIQFSRFSAGESKVGRKIADWRFKVDLTPSTVRLKHWARWGDVQAISKLLNFALAPEGIQISAGLKNLTLQIFCTFKHDQIAKYPSKKIVIDRIAPLLISLTPQGIQGATIHGLQSSSNPARHGAESPSWIHWLDLPALGDPNFSPTPMILAARGDRDAINFILERLLNPDLDQCFVSGGTQLSLLYHHHLIHVMSEAPICPIQSQVATTVVKVLQQLKLPSIRGVRVHGRIAGQSVASWTYGVDFDRAPLELPPVVIEHQFVVEPSITQISLDERIREYLVKTGIWKPQFALAKTNQLVYEPQFKWQPSLLLLLVGLGLATMVDLTIASVLKTRNMITAETEITAQLSFNNPLLEQKLAQYQLYCLEHGAPDLLIVGSSRALRGVDPAVLRHNLNTKYPNPKIYNFGINGATAQVVDAILRQLLTPNQLPKLVIWADGARAFNSGRIDRTYDSIASSDRYRKLAVTLGLKNSNSSLLQAQSSFQNTYQAIDTEIDRQLEAVSPAYHHRDHLKDLLRTKIPFILKITDGDNSTADIDPATSINERDVNAEGFLPLTLQFDPNTYYQTYTKVTGDSDGDYANFQLVGNQDRTFQQTIDLLAAQKIPLVFVNLPLSDVYLDKIRRQHEITFKAYMQKMMDANQLTFIDLDGLFNQKYDLFSDPSHLNQFGAIEVSKYLTQNKAIPWQVLTSQKVVAK